MVENKSSLFGITAIIVGASGLGLGAFSIVNSQVVENQLGMVIFHLQKNERINTVIRLQKLLDAALIVNPEEMFKILESADEGAQELAKKIKSIL
jgi:hypothetical protein